MPAFPTPIKVVGGFNPVKTIATLVGIGFGAWGVYELAQYAKKVRAKGALITDQASTITAPKGKVLKDLNGRPISSANLSTIVIDLHDSLKFPADEVRAIRVFKTIPWGYVKKVEQMYLDKYNENLKQVMADKFSDTEFIKVKYYFE